MKEEEIFDYVMCLSEEQINEKLAIYLGEPTHDYCQDCVELPLPPKEVER